MTSHYHYIQTYPTLSPDIPRYPQCSKVSLLEGELLRDAGIGKTFDATAIQESLTRLFESSHGFFTSGLTNLTDVVHIFCNNFHIFLFRLRFRFYIFHIKNRSNWITSRSSCVPPWHRRGRVKARNEETKRRHKGVKKKHVKTTFRVNLCFFFSDGFSTSGMRDIKQKEAEDRLHRVNFSARRI